MHKIPSSSSLFETKRYKMNEIASPSTALIETPTGLHRRGCATAIYMNNTDIEDRPFFQSPIAMKGQL